LQSVFGVADRPQNLKLEERFSKLILETRLSKRSGHAEFRGSPRREPTQSVKKPTIKDRLPTPR
jgi:hypothetical protein